MGTLYINHISKKVDVKGGRENRRISLTKSVGSSPTHDQGILEVRIQPVNLYF